MAVEAQKRICVKPLSRRVAETHLEEIFSTYGFIVDLYVPRKRPELAFIEYRDERDAQNAMDYLDSGLIDNLKVSVTWAPRPPNLHSSRSSLAAQQSSSRPRSHRSRSPPRHRHISQSRSRRRSRSPPMHRRRSRSPPHRRSRSIGRDTRYRSRSRNRFERERYERRRDERPRDRLPVSAPVERIEKRVSRSPSSMAVHAHAHFHLQLRLFLVSRATHPSHIVRSGHVLKNDCPVA